MLLVLIGTSFADLSHQDVYRSQRVVFIVLALRYQARFRLMKGVFDWLPAVSYCRGCRLCDPGFIIRFWCWHLATCGCTRTGCSYSPAIPGLPLELAVHTLFPRPNQLSRIMVAGTISRFDDLSIPRLRGSLAWSVGTSWWCACVHAMHSKGHVLVSVSVSALLLTMLIGVDSCRFRFAGDRGGA